MTLCLYCSVEEGLFHRVDCPALTEGRRNMTCDCEIGMCTHRDGCRLERREQPVRSRQARIERLRKRLAQDNQHDCLKVVVKGILDLLADEL